MISIRKLSIPNRIVAIIVIVSSAALLLSGAALVGYEVISERGDLTRNAKTIAGVIADNSVAAVQFQDQKAASDTLNTIRTDPSIIPACVYSDNSLFVEHLTANATPCPQQLATPAERLNTIVVSTPIQQKGRTIGAVQLHV